MKKVFVAAIVIVILGIVSYVLWNAFVMRTNTSPASIENDSRITVVLKSNASSETVAQVTLVGLENSVSVTTNVIGGDLREETTYPLSLKEGTCTTEGTLISNLPPVTNGFGEGEIDLTEESLREKQPVSIFLYNPADLSQAIACGEIL